MQTLLQERDQATERLSVEAAYAFSQLLVSVSEQYEGFRDGMYRRAFLVLSSSLLMVATVVTHLATLDCLISLATVGLAPGYVKPVSIFQRRKSCKRLTSIPRSLRIPLACI